MLLPNRLVRYSEYTLNGVKIWKDLSNSVWTYGVVGKSGTYSTASAAASAGSQTGAPNAAEFDPYSGQMKTWEIVTKSGVQLEHRIYDGSNQYRIPGTTEISTKYSDLVNKVQSANQTVTTTTQTQVPTVNSSAQELAKYVLENGLIDLQNYSWWKNNPNKDAAWAEVNKLQKTTTPAPTGAATSVGTVQSAPVRSGFTNDTDYQRALNEYNATGSWTKQGAAPAAAAAPQAATPASGDMFGKDSLGNYIWSADFEPNSLKNNEYYRSLDESGKLQVRYSYYLMQQNNAEKTQDFLKVLESAKSSSDVLFGQKLRLQYDELSSYLEDQTGDFQRRTDRLTKNIDEVNARIQDAGLEERAALEKEKRAYEQQLETTQNQLAGAGLTSSSIRDKAEARLSAEDQSIVEATKRQSESTRRGLQLQQTGYQTDLAQAAADKAEQLKTAARKLEEVLGTTEYQKIRSTYGELPEAIGTTADAFGKIVPITGTRKTEQLSDVQTRLSSLLGLTTPITFPK